MNNLIPLGSLNIFCPECGGKSFQIDADVHAKGEHAGATCDGCGYKLSDEDVVEQVTGIRARISQAIKKAGRKSRNR